MPVKQTPQEFPSSFLSLQTFAWIVLAMGIGTLSAVVILPVWMPHLVASLSGLVPKAYW